MTVRAETYKLLEGLCASEATLGVLGTSDGRVLRHGVEATIADLTSHTDGSGRATLVGGRLFRTLKELPSECVLSQAVPRMSPVHYLDLNLQDEIEKKREPNSRTLDLCARELGPLVMRWADLVRLTGRERTPGQLDDAFRALGEMPTADHPSERALWVAALMNPADLARADTDLTEGGTGGDAKAEEAAGDRKGDRASDRAVVADEETPSCLAHEIRPAVLGAESALERLSLAKTCIVDACYRLKGGKWPMDSYYW